MNNDKYFKMKNDNEDKNSQLKKEKKALVKIQKQVQKTIIKKNIKNTNFSPFMKAFYKLAL